jgi:hypothetical protein
VEVFAELDKHLILLLSNGTHIALSLLLAELKQEVWKFGMLRKMPAFAIFIIIKVELVPSPGFKTQTVFLAEARIHKFYHMI